MDEHPGYNPPVEQQAFRDMMLAEMDAVYRMAMHLARHPDEAQDLVQETYLKAFKAWKTFSPPAPPEAVAAPGSSGQREAGVEEIAAETSGNKTSGGGRPWLFKILHNTYFTRRKKRLREPTLGDDLPEPAWDLASLDWEQVDDRLKRAIDELPDHYREVLLLWAVEGLKYREVADVLGVALGTVMSRLYRARSMLSASLGELAAEHGLRR